MIAPARKFSILWMLSSSILLQSNPTGTRGSLDAVIMWFLILTGAPFAANASRATSASETPASAMHRPIKTRRLKNADFEADFFFIGVQAEWFFLKRPRRFNRFFLFPFFNFPS